MKELKEIADWNLGNCFVTQNALGDDVNIVDALLYMGNKIGEVAKQLERSADHLKDMGVTIRKE